MNMKKLFILILSLTVISFAGQTFMTPFMAFDFTIHRGIGDHYRGVGADVNLGVEVVAPVTSTFGLGMQFSSGIGYDAYMKKINGEDLVVDEYFPWLANIAVVAYIGNHWYLSGGWTKIMNIIDHNTYISTDEEDIDVDRLPYSISNWDYFFETGFRTSYNSSIGVKVSTNLIGSHKIDKSMYNFYFGFKVFA